MTLVWYAYTADRKAVILDVAQPVHEFPAHFTHCL